MDDVVLAAQTIVNMAANPNIATNVDLFTAVRNQPAITGLTGVISFPVGSNDRIFQKAGINFVRQVQLGPGGTSAVRFVCVCVCVCMCECVLM